MIKILNIGPQDIRYNLKVDLFKYALFDYKWTCFIVDNDMIMDDYLQRFFSAV
jgi:hypothetical protein